MRALARDCALTISVFARTGDAVPYRVASFRSQDGRDESARFEGLRVAHLACGDYIYELRRSDVETTIGRILGHLSLVESHQREIMQVEPDLITSEIIIQHESRPNPYTLRGSVSAVSSEKLEGVWVRLVSITGKSRIDVDLGDGGSFEFYGPPADTYALLILNSNGLLGARQIVIKEGQEPPFAKVNIDDGKDGR